MHLPPIEASDLESSDQDIIASVLAGDRERFGDLVRRHAGPLWSTVRASLRNLEDAREVFQETWLRAFERLDTLQDPRRLRAWLSSIALNLVRQGKRRSGWVESQSGAALDQTPSVATLDAEAAASRREELERLQHEIEKLPNRQREVLDLRLNHELSHRDIGEVLGITSESSRANFYQALRRLRALARATEPDECHGESS